jgi:glycosyltransferase involved in cell wall biosynthesis
MAENNSVPIISVTMCVYDGEKYLKEAVDSILEQTFDDLEFIIVDDGSTDSTAAILAGYKDPRLRVVNQLHLGISKSRNHALLMARGEYIAVLDADDTAHSTRLKTQIAYLRQHPTIVALGTGYSQVDVTRDRTRVIVPPGNDSTIRRAMVSGNPICHSSVLMRRSALERVGSYDETLSFSEDYELWSRLAQVGELANLPDALVTRRYHGRSVSNDMSKELLHLRIFWRVSNLAIKRLGFAWYYRLLPLRSICMFIASDLYRAVKHWWQRLPPRQKKDGKS